MLRELLHWFISLFEVIAVVVAILVAGLIIAVAAFWIWSKGLGKLSDAHDGSDPDEFPEPPNNAAPPS